MSRVPLLALLLALLSGCAAPPLRLPPDTLLVATYFTGEGRDGTFLAVSADGERFEPLLSPNIPLVRPGSESEGLMRDTWLGQGPDGRWRMVWSTGWGGDGGADIGYSESDDLVHWSAPRGLDVAAGLGVLNCWAPEVAFDPARAEYLIIWASTVPGAFPATALSGDLRDPRRGPLGGRWNHRLYYTTTRDFVAFAPARLFCDPGFDCIDATLLRVEGAGDRWVLLFKDETRTPARKWIVYMMSDDPTRWVGPVLGPISGGAWAEGPTAVEVGGTARVWWDRYAEGGWGVAQTTDWRHWTPASVEMPEGARHGTVLLVDRATVERVRDSLGTRGRR
jgi:hypothetical protein